MQFKKDIYEGGSNEGNSTFLKLKDKESVTGIFRGEPYEFFIVWENGKSRLAHENEPGAKFRFKINFVMKEGAVYVPKVFENGALVYQQLADLNEEYDLEETVVKITRNGTKLDTTYTILPLLKQEVTQVTKDFLKNMKLLDLEPKGAAPQATGPQGSSNDDLPF